MSDAQARAAHAKRLAEDPLLAEALANIRQAALDSFEATILEDDERRKVAWITVKVVGRIQAELQSVIDNGAIAARRIQGPLR
jgi:hypothetical protein